MARPVIGITVHTRARRAEAIAFELGAAAAQAVFEAGGLPLILPVISGAVPALLDRLDGLLLTGGGRRPPGFVPDRPAPTLEAVNPRRYAFERGLIEAALARQIPLLGICRGMQMINETLGGGLVGNIAADLPRALPHYQRSPGWRPTHGISITPGSRLAEIAGGIQADVNSFHRQAVATPGRGLLITALAPDGVVEAVEGTAGFILGVQFHPEKMVGRYEHWRRVFQALVTAARDQGG